MLNGRELIERGIVINAQDVNVQQHGVDLNVISIQRVEGNGIIQRNQTILSQYTEVLLEDLDESKYWKLTPGAYSVVFAQGCNVPNDQMLLIRQRSSLLRNGTIFCSSVFDAGFKTENIGTVMIVSVPITIEYYSRLAQIYNHVCTLVENLYNGQWQGDKQRKS